jgi:hypothetical protein
VCGRVTNSPNVKTLGALVLALGMPPHCLLGLNSSKRFAVGLGELGSKGLGQFICTPFLLSRLTLRRHCLLYHAQ